MAQPKLYQLPKQSQVGAESYPLGISFCDGVLSFCLCFVLVFLNTGIVSKGSVEIITKN